MAVDSLARAIAVKALNSGGEGAKDHDKLNNLDYNSSGHTGFASLAALTALGARVTTVEGKVGILKTDGDGTKALFDDGTYKTVSGGGGSEIQSLLFTENSTKNGFDYSLLLKDGTKFEGSLVFTDFMNASVYASSNAGTVKNSDALDGQDGSYYLDPLNSPYANVDITATDVKNALDEIIATAKAQGATIEGLDTQVETMSTTIQGIIAGDYLSSTASAYLTLDKRSAGVTINVSGLDSKLLELTNGLANTYTQEQVDTKLNDYATIAYVQGLGYVTVDVNNLTNYYTKSQLYTKLEVDAKLVGVYTFKGSVDTVADLPTNAEVGDVYDVKTDGTNYAWTGTIWDALGGIINLNDYFTKEEVTALLSAKANSSEVYTREYIDVNYYTNGEIDNLLNEKQETLIAGSNITINGNVISSQNQIPSTNVYAELYINTATTLSDTRPATTITVPYALTTTTAVTKSFTYTFTQDAVISASAFYGVWVYLGSMRSQQDYIVSTSYYHNTTQISNGTIQYETGNQETTAYFLVPMNVNLLQQNINVTSGSTVTLNITIQRTGGASHTMNLLSANTQPTTFVRNGGSVSSTNVIDYNGVDTANQSVRNRLYENGIKDNKTYYLNGIMLTQANFVYDSFAEPYQYSYTINVPFPEIGVTQTGWKCDITPAPYIEDIDFINQHCKMSNTGTNTLIYYFDAAPTADIRINDVSFWKLIKAGA